MGWLGEDPYMLKASRESFDSDGAESSSRSLLAQSIMPPYQILLAQNDKPAQQDKVPEINESQAPADRPQKARDRLDDNDFDIAAPLSNFRQTTDNVSRSGRPLVDNGGIDKLLEKLHPGKDRAYQNDNTVIIELRDEDQQMDRPEITQLNKGEVLGEEAYCKNANPPIEYHRFKMTSKQFQSPEKIDEIVGTMESAVQSGKKVSIHCFHGSDRSGLVSAAYLLAQDPQLRKQLISDPDEAYKTARRQMIENGCDPANYTTLFRSLKQYAQWKHEQLTGGTKTVDGQIQSPAVDTPVDANAQAKIDSLAQSMYSDTRFSSDPVSVYRDTLLKVSDQYDPATNAPFYKSLKQKYVDGPTATAPQKAQPQDDKPVPKAPPAGARGAGLDLPNLTFTAA